MAEILPIFAVFASGIVFAWGAEFTSRIILHCKRKKRHDKLKNMYIRLYYAAKDDFTRGYWYRKFREIEKTK